MVRCFACGRKVRPSALVNADTRDGQVVVVGPDCFLKIRQAGANGYQPPLGGPSLYDSTAAPRSRAEAIMLNTHESVKGYCAGHVDGFARGLYKPRKALPEYRDGYRRGYQAGIATRAYAEHHAILTEGLDGHR